MKMKQISAATIKDAMELARRELGEDAVLIDTKKSSKSSNIIVTFAIDAPDEVLFADDEPDTLPLPADILPFVPDIAKPAVSRAEIAHPAIEIVRDALAYHALPPALADKLMEHVTRQTLKPDTLLDVAEVALAKALDAVIPFKPIITNSAPPAKAIMLIGPHGAGKSSTIAKLATELTLHKQPIVIISTDTERMGGVDALHTLSELLKCEVVVSDSRTHLKGLIAKLVGKAWVLIDSTGANIYEFSQLKKLGGFASLHQVEPILTCPAGMDAHEAEEMVGVFDFLPIERMIVTRLDAVRRMGSLFAALTAGGYALSNYSQSALPSQASQPNSAAAMARFMLRHVRERMTHQ